MEQLEHTCPSTSGRLMDVKKVVRKVRIKLTKQQLESLTWLMQVFLSHFPLITLKDKSSFLIIFQVFEKKIRTKQLSIKQKNGLSLDISQAEAMQTMASFVLNMGIGMYEKNLIREIVAEIHRQTC